MIFSNKIYIHLLSLLFSINSMEKKNLLNTSWKCTGISFNPATICWSTSVNTTITTSITLYLINESHFIINNKHLPMMLNQSNTTDHFLEQSMDLLNHLDMYLCLHQWHQHRLGIRDLACYYYQQIWICMQHRLKLAFQLLFELSKLYHRMKLYPIL